MGRSREAEEASAAGDDNTFDDADSSYLAMGTRGGNKLLGHIFSCCQDDARRSIHRAWGVTVLFMITFLVIAFIEGKHIQQDGDAPMSLVIAAYYTAFLHLIIIILGTFVLKRFSTAFTVGCFLGVTAIVSQQNLLMFVAFINYQHGDSYSNAIFADLALALFMLMGFFTLILGHFRDQIIE
mmetsp:Transcript_9178/g.19582  ORF Transcript_9178/g.19582 Transcript_9178/m.19582 type:complete len:182 (-) Transcript_9178:297-842(-)